MFGPALPLDLAQLQSLGGFISGLFGDAVDVKEVFQVKDGANANNHYAASVGGNCYYGLKLPTRTGPLGPINEKILADIGIQLGAPNMCRVEQSSDIAFIPAFSGQRVNVTRWLPDSKKLSQLDQNERNSLRSRLGAGCFYEQLGQLMVFGLLFGIGDRHTGNWVISTKDELAIIDAEDAFGASHIAHYNWWPEYLDRAEAKAKELLYPPLACLGQGCCNMVSSFASKRPAIEAILAAQPHASGFKPSYWDLRSDEIVEELLSAV
jgi:hypothetical protein